MGISAHDLVKALLHFNVQKGIANPIALGRGWFMSDKYILNGRTPVQVDDVHEWGRWFENADRRVAFDKVKLPTGSEVEVSTVFLGLDHSFGGKTPILFETMIFGGKHNEYCDRYSTWEEAEEGHKRAVELAKSDDGMRW